MQGAGGQRHAGTRPQGLQILRAMAGETAQKSLRQSLKMGKEGERHSVQEMCRLRQKQEMRVRGREGRAGAVVSRKERERGRERRGLEERERDPKKQARSSTLPAAVVWAGTFISRTLSKADGWCKSGGAAAPAGRTSAQLAAPGGAVSPRTPPLRALRNPDVPRLQPTPARPACARRWHEIGCSRNESAPRGGG